MPWPVPSARTIFERIAATVEQALSVIRPDIDPTAISRAARSSRGMISVLQRPVALEAREIHDHIAFYARQYFPDTAEEEFVLRHAAIWGIEQRAATAAIGTVLVEGAGNTSLPAGLELSAAGLVFVTTQPATIGADGHVTVPVRAEKAGTAGNLPGGTVLRTVTPFPGTTNVTVTGTGLTGGTEAESWQDVRDAILTRIRQPPHGGAGFDYPRWLRDKFDVRAVAVIPDWVGRGSVGIVVAMRDGNSGRPPSAEETDAMLDYLGRPGSPGGVRPVTAHVIIVSAIPRPIAITIRVRPDTIAVRQAIAEAWAAFVLTIGDANDDFNTTPIGANIERSRIIEALSAAAGEYAHDLIEPATNITLGRTEYPIAGSVKFVEAS